MCWVLQCHLKMHWTKPKPKKHHSIMFHLFRVCLLSEAIFHQFSLPITPIFLYIIILVLSSSLQIHHYIRPQAFLPLAKLILPFVPSVSWRTCCSTGKFIFCSISITCWHCFHRQQLHKTVSIWPICHPNPWKPTPMLNTTHTFFTLHVLQSTW